MARSAEHVPYGTAKEFRAGEYRLRRRDVILARGELVDRLFHFAQVESPALDGHPALAQIVLQVAVTQVEFMIGRGHAGRIRVPDQEVERHRLLAFEIVVDPV